LIKKVVTKMLVILPFEEALYKKYGVDVTFVGHPLLDAAKPTVNKEQFLKSVGLAPNNPTISLLPGSRQREVKKLLPIMLKSCAIIHGKNPKTQFMLLKASTVNEDTFRKILSGNNLPLALVKEQTYNGLHASDAAMVASGTATLETAILGIPMVIIYKVSFFTWFFIRQMIKIPYVGLVNIIASRKIVPECLQYEARPEIIAENITKILSPKESYSIKNELSKLRESLGASGASRRAAEIVAGLIQ